MSGSNRVLEPPCGGAAPGSGRSSSIPALPVTAPAAGAATPPTGRAPLQAARLRERLRGCALPYRIQVVAQTDSTQLRARAAVAAGAAEGWAMLAEEQTAGRGRSGQGWVAPPGSALLASVVLRPGVLAPTLAPLALVAGVAVAEAVEAVGGPAVRLKWPNDCLALGRKLAGVLVEGVDPGPGADPGAPAVVVGIGCNVEAEPSELGPDLAGVATSCRAAGRPVSREALAVAVLSALADAYRRWQRQGFEPARAAWLARAADLGREVEATGPAGPLRGRVVGLDAAGGLRLETAGGAVTVRAGAVRHLRPG